ncbi:VosA [Metarhizium rileyi]|uniref:VosA n=1 Tax=Metarhizium rileyi (strain RCEF 4871) TaxID=1649241 RepID=A0A167KDU1_METRR|nr:VosA [Metarhizium rileyi RCEF 4871]
MASEVSNCLDLPFMQPSIHHHSVPTIQYLAGGELPIVAEEIPQEQQQQQAKYYGDTHRQLTLRQAPMHARVAVGKEKGPYLFMTSSLLPENYDELAKGPELPSNYLVGSLASSIHRLRDTDNMEGGFFVFGDLSVKQEGRYRLRFTLYERDQNHPTPSFYFIGELITNVFTVFPAKLFPGMTDSTALTRTFSDQGVKVRLRKDSSTMAARKRNRQANESSSTSSSLLDRQPKRPSYDREMPSLSNYALSELGHMDPISGSSSLVTTASHNPNMFSVSGPLPTSRGPGLDLQIPTSGYYFGGPQYY